MIINTRIEENDNTLARKAQDRPLWETTIKKATRSPQLKNVEDIKNRRIRTSTGTPMMQWWWWWWWWLYHPHLGLTQIWNTLLKISFRHQLKTFYFGDPFAVSTFVDFVVKFDYLSHYTKLLMDGWMESIDQLFRFLHEWLIDGCRNLIVLILWASLKFFIWA